MTLRKDNNEFSNFWDLNFTNQRNKKFLTSFLSRTHNPNLLRKN